MSRILVVGAGRVGAAMAVDLAREAGVEVTAADPSSEALAAVAASGATTVRLDPGEQGALEAVAAEHDVAVGAVPGAVGYATVGRLVAAGVDVVDISFFPEDPFTLDAAAREAGVRVWVDCGVAPGLSNLLLGHAVASMEEVERFRCLVGGLPAGREGPWEYRAPFSPRDVIEEYVRPARLRRGGETVVRPALSEVEGVELPGVGEVEAFLTDGLRTLLRTTDVPHLEEKTLRWPGHADRIRTLRESGFFDEEPVTVDGVAVRPVELTARLLEDAWRPGPGEEELTVMRVEVEGTDGGRKVRRVWDLLDRTAPDGTSSMARTTGYTCTALVRWMLDAGGRIAPGVAAPETLASEEGCVDFVTSHLAERGVELRRTS